MTPYRVILADNYAPLRQGLRRILNEQTDIEIAGEAEEGLDLLSLVRSTAAGPLMVILDLSLPKLRATEVIRAIKEANPETKVLILSIHEDVEYLSQALASGAEGYLMKESASKDLLRAIATIRQGNTYVPEVLPGVVPGWSLTNSSNGR